MKQIVFLLIGLFIIGCLKDTTEPTKTETYQTSTVSDVDFQLDIRDGEKLPLDFHISQVEYNPLITENPQTAFNIFRIDSVKYERVSTSGVNPFNSGVIFHKYFVTRYFNGGETYTKKVYANSSLGQLSVIIPQVANNQLRNSNPYNYITIIRGKRTEQYFDHICGIVKKRLFYTELAEIDTVGQFTIDGNNTNCNVNVFSYKFMY